MFKIVSEGSSGAGVRRIEAVTGHGAVAHVNATEEMVNGLAAELKCRCCDVPTRLEALQCELKAAQKKAEELAAEIAKAQVSNVADQIKDANSVPVLVQKVNADSVDALRNLGDQMRDKVGGVVVLAAVMGEKVSILTMLLKMLLLKAFMRATSLRLLLSCAAVAAAVVQTWLRLVEKIRKWQTKQ